MADLTDLAEQALDAAREALAMASRPNVGRIVATVGPPPFDDCCAGQLYLSLLRVYPSASFPVEDTVLIGHCSPYPFAVSFRMGVVRCSPMPSDDGTPPPPASVMEATMSLTRDLQTIVVAMRDEIWWHEHEEVLVGGIEYLSDEGGCIAGEVPVLASIELLEFPETP